VEERRLFFALWPDERQREKLRNTLSPLVRQIEGRAVPRSNWHVTLVFVGSVPAERVGELMQAADTVTPEPFRLRFDRLAYWQRARIACLEAVTVPPSLAQLVAGLNAVTAGLGIEAEAHRFRPHVTAVRAARPFDSMPLARPLVLSWSGFELVESIPVPDGVEYRPLKQELRRDS